MYTSSRCLLYSAAKIAPLAATGRRFMNPGIHAAIAVGAARSKARDGVVRLFRDASATSPDRAQALRDRFTDRHALSEMTRLVDAGVIRRLPRDRFYLDESALGDYNASCRRVAAMVVIA